MLVFEEGRYKGAVYATWPKEDDIYRQSLIMSIIFHPIASNNERANMLPSRAVYYQIGYLILPMLMRLIVNQFLPLAHLPTIQ